MSFISVANGFVSFESHVRQVRWRGLCRRTRHGHGTRAPLALYSSCGDPCRPTISGCCWHQHQRWGAGVRHLSQCQVGRAAHACPPAAVPACRSQTVSMRSSMGRACAGRVCGYSGRVCWPRMHAALTAAALSATTWSAPRAAGQSLQDAVLPRLVSACVCQTPVTGPCRAL